MIVWVNICCDCRVQCFWDCVFPAIACACWLVYVSVLYVSLFILQVFKFHILDPVDMVTQCCSLPIDLLYIHSLYWIALGQNTQSAWMGNCFMVRFCSFLQTNKCVKIYNCVLPKKWNFAWAISLWKCVFSLCFMVFFRYIYVCVWSFIRFSCRKSKTAWVMSLCKCVFPWTVLPFLPILGKLTRPQIYNVVTVRLVKTTQIVGKSSQIHICFVKFFLSY